MTKLELLSPAKNADIGIEAIRHGADAVYIGAPKFGARSAAGNSLEDISRLVEYAHRFAAKVYVTINTILTDEELIEAETMINQLYNVNVDALIVQDLGLLKLNLPPIPLHASTQMNNSTPDKVRQLRDWGFGQAVLARELTLEEIRVIHEDCPDIILEAFVHGALCVSLSGQCYASECLFGRSANRGECAQVCRMEFDLIQRTYKGNEIVEQPIIKGKHLLSLKDMCQLDSLQKLIDVGVTSFKIEGRLKEMSYVKNITAAYSEVLNRIVLSQPNKYERTSVGQVDLKFKPDVNKSFNRSFTNYFLFGRNDNIFSFDTPKSMGEEVGTVKEIYLNCFTVAGLKSFSNGDGLCFVDRKGKLFGFRVNKIDDGRLYPLDMPKNILPKMKLYRNYDKKFEDLLQRESAERFISVDMTLCETETGFHLSMSDDYGLEKGIDVDCPKELARSHQSENIERQLSKLGGTIYRLRSLNIDYKKNWFIPSSMLSEWRRELTSTNSLNDVSYGEVANSLLIDNKMHSVHSYDREQNVDLSYLANVMNQQAKSFYEAYGYKVVDWAYEKTHPDSVPIMFCKHCIKYSIGWCHKSSRYREDVCGGHDETLFLQLATGRRFRLEFDCRKCMMKLIGE